MRKTIINRKKKTNTPLAILLGFVFGLLVFGVSGTFYFYQKAARAQKELASLSFEVRKETKEKVALTKKLEEAQRREDIIARTRVRKEERIDPVEAALLKSDSMPEVFEPDPRIITHGNRNQKKVAITIDDGWNADNHILDLMEFYGIRCTVFVIGGRDVAESHKNWLRRMDQDGFEICTHTYSHYLVTGLTENELRRDIKKGQRVLTRVTNKAYPYLRTCGGIYNEEALNVIDDLGYKLVLWDVELRDTDKNATVDSEIRNVLENVKNGSIVLCHFGGYHTYRALRTIIPELLRRGYTITTVSDVLKED